MESTQLPMSVGQFDLAPQFDPWIGSAYRDRAERLAAGELFSGSNWFVHVLGESHYRGDYEVDRHLTNAVVSDWAGGTGRGSVFFHRILQAVHGKPYGEADHNSGWADIAYSNYIQDTLDGPRKAPSEAQWADARRRFFGQLAITRPRVLLVLGRRLWDRLPFGEENRVEPLGLPDPSNPVTDAWAYPYEVNGVKSLTIAVWAYHPSSSKFDAKDARRKVVAADMAYDNLTYSVIEELGW